jgi:hypothetical protein
VAENGRSQVGGARLPALAPEWQTPFLQSLGFKARIPEW